MSPRSPQQENAKHSKIIEEELHCQSKDTSSACDNDKTDGKTRQQLLSPSRKHYPLKKSGTTNEAMEKEKQMAFQQQ